MKYDYEDVKKEHPGNLKYKFSDVYEELLWTGSPEEDAFIKDYLIKKHIEILSPLHKEVIGYHLEGFSNKEIAEKTSLKPVTVERITSSFDRYSQYLSFKNKIV